MKRRIFLDTAYLLALINRSDEYYTIATTHYRSLIKQKFLLITTEAVLIETGNSLAKPRLRSAAYQWLKKIRLEESAFRVIPVGTDLLAQGVELYGLRPDKEWGLTDCISFIVMQHENLRDALTFDHHFEQAGYNIFPKVGPH